MLVLKSIVIFTITIKVENQTIRISLIFLKFYIVQLNMTLFQQECPNVFMC